MQRLRERWVALLGGAVLLALSVSTVVGADPVDTDEPRGRTVAAFVHSLIFGQGEAPDGNLDEEVIDDEVTNGTEGTDQLTEDTEASAHGACVSEVAQDKDAVGGPKDNHGGAVSEAARETCRQDEPVVEVELLEEQADRHGACVSEVAQDKDAVGGPNDNHGGAVSEAARETCHEDAADAEGAEGDADASAEAADASAEAPRERGNSAFGHGRGNRGGGRP